MSAGRPPWLFDETRDFGFSSPTQVAAYEQDAHPGGAADDGPWRTLGLSAEDVAIDFGCGAGGLAIEAAKICRRVVGVDVSGAMVEAARVNAERAGVGNIVFVQSGFLTYEHAGEPADIAVSVHALHHLPDFWKVEALRRIARSMRPGGLFYLRDIVYSFEPAKYANAIGSWIDAVASDGVRPGLPRPFFEEHVRDEYSTYSWLLEPMLAAAGFAVRDAVYSDSGTYAQYTCLRT